ncbi:MAG: hypothetical protein K9J83_01210, partial [Desulfarculaceae bacterium]|nr:hypothetical protein [Desulfarculaceae bacterium]
MKRVFVWMVLLVTAAGFSGVQAAPLPGEKVPQPLKPWIGWVLHGQGDTRCPVVYNDVSGKICVWPSALSLAFNAEKASFSQKWKVYQENARVMLPGSRDLWPQKVTVDGSAHPVGKENGHPYVFLEKAGKYTVKGNFEYRRIPENINVPGHTGIVDLTVKGKPVPFPRLDRQGRLWLGSGGPDAVPEEQKQADSIHIKVHRLIRDDIPARMVTRLDLKVSGSHRKETVGRAFTDRFIPLAMESPLPARIEKDGNLVLQVRPGDWTVTITTRHKGPLTSLSMADAGRLENADTEVWSFQPFDHLRMVDITGPPRVDPEQTTMPPDWRNYPAFIMEPGTEMDFSVKKRGDPNPAPDRLNLDRRLWLDFDGDGFSVIDSITGSMTTGWRLSADPQLSLGRVTVNGEPRLITRLE